MRYYKNTSAGFTLVELLAVMLIFAVIGTIAVGILVTSLRTAAKTNIITTVKQNGNYTISQMVSIIRDSRSLRSPFPCVVISPTPPVVSKSITVTAADGGQVTFACTDIAPTPTPPSSNTIASNGASLLDTNAVNLVPNSCQFTCSQQSPSDYPIIGILFSLTQHSTSTLVENLASATAVDFSTSITLRNLNR